MKLDGECPECGCSVSLEFKARSKTSRPDVIKVVNAYKVAKNVGMADKGWDRANFARCAKSAKLLLDRFGTPEGCAAYMFVEGGKLDDLGLDWKLETIVRRAWDNVGLKQGEDESESSAVGHDESLEPRRYRGITPPGKAAWIKSLPQPPVGVRPPKEADLERPRPDEEYD